MEKPVLKVCGMRDPQNIDAVIAAGADLIGLIFYEKSKRNIDAEAGERLVKNLPPVKKVGVFVNEQPKVVRNRIVVFALDFVQLHGEESVEYCENLRDTGVKIIKVFSVGSDFNFPETEKYEAVADYFLFDTKGKQRGGNGVKFDWNILQNYRGKIPFLLSGGIGEEDAEAVRDFEHPLFLGVDVNSGFETEAGRKDARAVGRFSARVIR